MPSPVRGRNSEAQGHERRVAPKKCLGQNFLVDAEAAAKIVGAVEGAAGAYVVEIGPGMGVLTRGLLERFAGRFTCLELDERAVEYLREIGRAHV